MEKQVVANFEREEVQLISDSAYFWLSFVQRITLMLTLVSYTLLIFIVFVYSPRRLGNYKWYIIINATVGTAFEIINVTFALYPLLPYPVIVCRGFADIWMQLMNNEPPEIITRFVFNCGVLCTIFLVYSTTSMFVYRYLQTTQKHELLYLASNMKIYLLSYVVVGVLCGLLILLPVNLQLMSNEELHEGIRQVDPIAYEKMRNHLSIGFSTKTGQYYIFTGLSATVLMIFCGSAIIYSTYFCYRYLRQNKYMLSTKVAALFKSLINILIIDLFVGFVACGTLTALSTLTFVLRARQGSLIMVFALTVGDLYPLYSHAIVILYIEPFRHALIRILRPDRFIRIPKPPTHMDVYS